MILVRAGVGRSLRNVVWGSRHFITRIVFVIPAEAGIHCYDSVVFRGDCRLILCVTFVINNNIQI